MVGYEFPWEASVFHLRSIRSRQVCYVACFAIALSASPGAFAQPTDTSTGHASALDELVATAQAGDARAQATLGTMYFDGIGVARDHRKALAWNLKAAAQNRPDALRQLGRAYANPVPAERDDPPTNEAAAVQYWADAYKFAEPLAQANDPEALYVQADLLTRRWAGPMLPIAEVQKISSALMTKAASQGYPPAQVWVGYNLLPSKPEEAMNWFFRAAIQGDSDGMEGMGTYFDKKGDRDSAILWLTRAANMNDLEASRMLLRTYHLTVGDPRADYIAGGRLNPHGDIALPGHSGPLSNPLARDAVAMFAAVAILGLIGPKTDAPISTNPFQWQPPSYESQRATCLMAGNVAELRAAYCNF